MSIETNEAFELSYYKAEDGYNYIDTFHKTWLSDHSINLSGPVDCYNCLKFGTIYQFGIQIVLGYCLNCAIYIYNKERGPGFSGFNTFRIVSNYEYPEYLYKYIDTIIELSEQQDYHNFNDNQNNIDDIDVNLSEKDSDVYTDSDDEDEYGNEYAYFHR